MARAVLYARVSGNDQVKTGGENLQDQLKLCREYAQARGYSVVAELAEDDRGASGAAMDLPQLSRALEVARAGQFDVLVVRELDRLSRDLTKQLIVEQELKHAGVSIEYVLYDFPDTPEGRLNKNLRAMLAEYEREKIKQRMVRGRRRKVRNGAVIVHGIPPYGYRVEDVNGKRMLALDDTEAPIVALIFELYTRGHGDSGPLSQIGIQRYLERRGIPCPADSNPTRCRKAEHSHTWKVGTIANIMKRKTYVGEWCYGKRGDHPIKVRVPAIIDQETFAAARRQAKANTKHAARNTKHEYLLQRRLRCSCGRAMTVGSRKNGRLKYYYCGGRTVYDTPDGKQACTMPYFRADHIDAAAWDWLVAHFEDEDALLTALHEQQDRSAEQTQPQRERLTTVDQMIAGKMRALRKLLNRYLVSDFPAEWLAEHKNRIDGELEGLRAQQVRLRAVIEKQVLSDARIESVVELAHYVREGILDAAGDFEKRRHLVELLDLTGELTIEDDDRVLYLHCLAGDDRLSITTHYIGIAR